MRRSPWRALTGESGETLPVSLTGIEKYKSIEVTNDSGALVLVVANGATAHPKPIIAGAVQEIELNSDILTLDVTGSGDGNVYVTGLLK
jgi:hypothetical protein